MKNYKEYRTIDKSEWQRGEWNDEPDKAQWIDEDTDLDCLIVRGSSGALCGYVGVPEGHCAFSTHYDGVDVNVHGGLTFSAFCQHSEDETKGVCHVPAEGRPDRVWWLGFDCAHSGDVSPKYERASYGSYEESYKGIGYVKKEIRGLARQLRDMAQTDEKYPPAVSTGSSPSSVSVVLVPEAKEREAV